MRMPRAGSSRKRKTPGYVRELAEVCRDAWLGGLLTGFNGNVSCRLGHSPARPERICITCSGVSKARLGMGDFCLVDLETMAATPFGKDRPSIETGMHAALYRAFPWCKAIVHSHPQQLTALGLLVAEKDFLALELFEALYWRKLLAIAPALPPGSPNLAEAAVNAAMTVAMDTSSAGPQAGDWRAAIWLSGHGLCCLATSPSAALAMSEQYEHLAGVQLLGLAR